MNGKNNIGILMHFNQDPNTLLDRKALYYKDNIELKFYYFKHPKEFKEHKKYFILVIETFFYIFMIFKRNLFGVKFKIKDVEWESEIIKLNNKLKEYCKRYGFQ